jgi:hypothetical protein
VGVGIEEDGGLYVGVAIVGVVLYGERLTFAQWVCMAAIAGGIVGLKALGSAAVTHPAANAAR